MMEERGDLLESGVFDGHLYGTPKPPENPEEGLATHVIGTPAREKPQHVPPNKLPPNMVSGTHSGTHVVPKLCKFLLSNYFMSPYLTHTVWWK